MGHLIHDKTINYLIIGDKDCSNWEIKNDLSNINEIINICLEKERNHETIGFTLTWNQTLIGGEFLFWPDQNYSSFAMCLNSDRQVITLQNNYTITNFQWYLEKLFASVK